MCHKVIESMKADIYVKQDLNARNRCIIVGCMV